MFVVGLTGGIGSGKSAVSRQFAALGIEVVDADVAARTVVEVGKPTLTHIADHFGKNVLLEDGNLDRAALRKIIFEKPEERGWLEKLLHPLIYTEIKNQLRSASSDYVILASPLLIETGQNRLANRILVVDVSEDIQVQRTMQRDTNSETQVRAIMDAQTSREKRLSHADDVINNEESLEQVKEQVEKLHALYLQLASESE